MTSLLRPFSLAVFTACIITLSTSQSECSREMLQSYNDNKLQYGVCLSLLPQFSSSCSSHLLHLLLHLHLHHFLRYFFASSSSHTALACLSLSARNSHLTLCQSIHESDYFLYIRLIFDDLILAIHIQLAVAKALPSTTYAVSGTKRAHIALLKSGSLSSIAWEFHRLH